MRWYILNENYVLKFLTVNHIEIASRTRLECFEIAVFQERGPYVNDVGSFIECNFNDKTLLEFLSSIYIHIAGEDLGDFSKAGRAGIWFWIGF
jgi:hypothetical protein